jgi:D-lactate dehydrogenase
MCRRLHIAYTRVMAGNYSLGPLVGMELRGKTVAVIGTGAIGQEACRIFKVVGIGRGFLTCIVGVFFYKVI